MLASDIPVPSSVTRSLIILSKEDDSRNSDQPCSTTGPTFHLLQQPRNGGHRDVTVCRGRASCPGLPQCSLQRDAPDPGLSLCMC